MTWARSLPAFAQSFDTPLPSALVDFDFRFMVEKKVESEVLVFTQSNTTNAFKLLFDSLLLHILSKYRFPCA